MPDDLSAQAPPADGGEDHQEGTDGEQTAELPFIPTTRTHFSSNVPSGQSSAIDASTGSLVQASDFFADDEDDEWQVRTPPKRLRLRVPTAVLVGLLTMCRWPTAPLAHLVNRSSGPIPAGPDRRGGGTFPG